MASSDEDDDGDDEDDLSSEDNGLSRKERAHLAQERDSANGVPNENGQLLEQVREAINVKPAATSNPPRRIQKPKPPSTFLDAAEFARRQAAGPSPQTRRNNVQRERSTRPPGFVGPIGKAFWKQSSPALRSVLEADALRTQPQIRSTDRGRQSFDFWATSAVNLPDIDSKSDDERPPPISGDRTRSGRDAGIRRVLYVLCLGYDTAGNTAQLAPRGEAILQFLAAWFKGLPVKTLPPLSHAGLGLEKAAEWLPRSQFKGGASAEKKQGPLHQQLLQTASDLKTSPILTQLDASKIQTVASNMLPEDGYAVIVLTPFDLHYPRNANRGRFSRVVICSWARYHPEFFITVPKRSVVPVEAHDDEDSRLKQSEITWQVCSNACHEVMRYIMNVNHCSDFLCRMNAENSTAGPRGSFDLCPLCLSKLSVAVNPHAFDAIGRYVALRDVCSDMATLYTNACLQWSCDAAWFRVLIKEISGENLPRTAIPTISVEVLPKERNAVKVEFVSPPAEATEIAAAAAAAETTTTAIDSDSATADPLESLQRFITYEPTRPPSLSRKHTPIRSLRPAVNVTHLSPKDSERLFDRSWGATGAETDEEPLHQLLLDTVSDLKKTPVSSSTQPHEGAISAAGEEASVIHNTELVIMLLEAGLTLDEVKGLEDGDDQGFLTGSVPPPMAAKRRSVSSARADQQMQHQQQAKKVLLAKQKQKKKLGAARQSTVVDPLRRRMKKAASSPPQRR